MAASATRSTSGDTLTKPLLRPNFEFLADTLEGVPIHPYLPQTDLVIDGTRYLFNGWNQAWYADISAGALFPLGSVAPSTFVVADDAGGTAFTAGTVLFYYLVFRNTNRLEETAPQPTNNAAGVPVAGVEHTMGGTKDALITWDDPGDGRWNVASIYRRLQGSDLIVRVDDVPIAMETYVDDTVDDDLDLTDIYIDRYRLTLPPVFLTGSPHMGRIFAITGLDSLLYWSEPVRPDGELTQVDFRPRSIVAIDPDDGLGPLVALVAHYDSTIAFKRKGIVLIEGNPVDDSFAFRTLYRGRGAMSPRSVVPVDGAFIANDDDGMYAWLPSSEPRILGARADSPLSPLTPLWARVNRNAWRTAHLVYRREMQTVECYLPLDREPIAKRAAVWNKEHDTFDSIDDRVQCASGTLEEAGGREHENYIDDLGLLWERSMIDSQGVRAGGTHATFLTAGPVVPGRILCAIPTFEPDPTLGAEGTPTERYSAEGELLDENRAYLLAANVVDHLYWSPEPVAFSNTIDVGVMVSVGEFSRSDFGTRDRATVMRVIATYNVLETILGVSPTASFYSSADERGYALRRTVDMTTARGWALVPCWDRGFHYNLKIEKRKATDRFEFQALAADLWTTRIRRP